MWKIYQKIKNIIIEGKYYSIIIKNKYNCKIEKKINDNEKNIEQQQNVRELE